MLNWQYKCYAITLLALSQVVMAVSHARVPQMYVSNLNDGTVSIVDIESREVIETVSGFVEPTALAWDGFRGMYVADQTPPAGRVMVIDVINHTLSEISGPCNYPSVMALNGGTGMYVVNDKDASVCVVDTQTAAVGVVIPLIDNSDIVAMAFDGVTGMYLADNQNECVYVIDTHSLAVSPGITFGIAPYALGWDGATGMYVAGIGSVTSDNLVILNTQTHTVSNTMQVGDVIQGLGWDGSTGMYAAGQGSTGSALFVIDTQTQTVSNAISIEGFPDALAWDVSSGMYLTVLNKNAVDIIDTETFQVVKTLAVGRTPIAIARAGIPVLLTVQLQNTPEATMQLFGGAPVSLYGKPIPDLLPLTTVQIHVPDTGVVRYPVLANIAPSTTTALSTQVLQESQLGMIALTIAQE